MRSVLLLAALASTITLSAQTAPSAPVLLVRPQISAGCPVGLVARHAADGGFVQVSPGTKQPHQSYSITLTPQNARGIAQARITLGGMSGAHVLPAGPHPGRDATESFNITPSADDHHFTSIIYVHTLTGVQWVELNEITWADGTRWHASPAEPCRITPDGFMLIEAKK